MKKRRKYLLLLLLLGGVLSVTFFLGFRDRTEDTPYVHVIPETLNVQAGDLFDLAIDSNVEFHALNIVSSNLSTVRLEGSKLRALSGGTAFITVQTQDGLHQDSVVITVNSPVTSKPVEEPSFEITIGNERFTYNQPVLISQLEAPRLDGFTFIGFSLEQDGPILENEVVIDESLTLFYIYETTQETTQPPVVEESPDGEHEETEEPVDEDEGDDLRESTPASVNVTLESDQGTPMDHLTVSPGAVINASDFEVERSHVGYFLKGQTCENPFDFETPIVTHTTLVFGERNYTSPCIDLDEMATTGKMQVGETIQVFISPSAATITVEWFISENDRDYRLIRNITGSALELVPEYFRQYIAVKLTGTGDYIGTLSLPLGRVGLNTQTIETPSNDYFIRTWADLASMKTGEESRGIIYTLANNLNQSSPGYDTYASSTANGGAGWIPIGDFFEPFMGSFDGNGFTIADLVIQTSDNNIGLFGAVGADGFYENLTFENVQITAGKQAGILIGQVNRPSELLFKNITITGSEINAGNNVGGLVGSLNNDEVIVTAEAISTNLSITGIESVGGLFGFSQAVGISIGSVDAIFNVTGDAEIGSLIGSVKNNNSNLNMQNISANLIIDGDSEIGGLIGFLRVLEVSIRNVDVNLNISGRSEIGGLIGDADTLHEMTINTVTSSGLISGNGDQLGGIIGEIDSGIITLSSINQMSNIISSFDDGGGAEAGGFVGDNEGDLRIIDSKNMGNVEAQDDRVGGLVGVNSKLTNIHTSMNYGNITSQHDKVGGIIGENRNENNPGGHLILIQVENHGRISGKNNVGGIIGKNSSQTNISQSANLATILFEGESDIAIGGLVGLNHQGNLHIHESYNLGLISGTSINNYDIFAGGLIGYVEEDGDSTAFEIINSYNAGDVITTNVTGNSYIGGLVGRITSPISSGSIVTSYNVGNLTGTANGSITIGGIIGVNEPSNVTISDNTFYLDTTAEFGYNQEGQNLSRSAVSMTSIETFTGWDIGSASDVWSIGYQQFDTYPWLSWQEKPIDADIIDLIVAGYRPIASAEDFIAIRLNGNHNFAEGTRYNTGNLVGGLTRNYVLVNNIDMSSYTWTRSVIDGNFSGNISGMGFSISNVNISGSGMLGLFEGLSNAIISDLTLADFNITGTQSIGTLSPIVSSNTQINNVNVVNANLYASGTTYVAGVGGLFGRVNPNGLRWIENSSFNGNISGSQVNVGGVIGRINSGHTHLTLSSIIVSGVIESTGSQIGGIIGNNEYSSGTISIINAINQATVIGGSNVGGIIGSNGNFGTVNNQKTYILQTINEGTIGSSTNIGGFIGYIISGETVITDSYNVAIITGSNSGGFIGTLRNHSSIQLSISHSYTSTANATDALIGNKAKSGVTLNNVYHEENSSTAYSQAYSLTNSQMRNTVNFNNLDFLYTWDSNENLNGGYPYLRWAKSIIAGN